MTTQGIRPLRLGVPRLSAERARDLGPLLAFVALFVVLSIASESFFTARNLLNVLEQWAPTLILALGGTIVVVSGALDLSVGAMFTLSGVSTVMLTNASGSIVVGIIAGLAIGTALGLANGLLSTAARITPFVATLGTSIAFAGLALWLTGGTFQVVKDPAFAFASKDLLGVNVSIWIALVVLGAVSFLLAKTSFGRYLYAVGGNVEAARLAGVRVDLVRVAAFAAAGLTAAVAALLMVSRSSSAGPADASGTAFMVWTAILIGGNSLSGGHASPWRTVVGVFTLALISNGFTLMQLDPLIQQVLTGGILLLAVGIDAWSRARRR